MRFSTILIIILRNIELALRDVFRLRFRPYKVLLELTDHCNSKCKTCEIWKPGSEKKNEIKVKDLEPILQEYGANLLWVALGGGEVTLYKDFDRLIDLLGAHCPNLRILTFTTNALMPEKVLEFAQKIKSRGYDVFITISLDGDKKAHDFIRGVDGNYEKAQGVLEQLNTQNIWSHFGLTVSGFNSEYIEKNLQHDIENIRCCPCSLNLRMDKANQQPRQAAREPRTIRNDPSLNQLVRAREQRPRKREPDRLGSLEIDD